MTSYLTIDAGIAYRAIAPSPHQKLFLDQLSQWQQSGLRLCAPSLWAYEITSIFTKSGHFKQLGWDTSREAIRLAWRLDLELFPPNEELIERAFDWTRRLQRAAAYDSFYLALAEALGSEFWTVDKRLANAVGQPWVKVLGLPA
jgi:predicted nucleic acid-binding protein